MNALGASALYNREDVKKVLGTLYGDDEDEYGSEDDEEDKDYTNMA